MDFSGYLSNVKVNLTFSSNFVHTLKSSTVQMRFQFTPIHLMQWPTHLVFAFFDTFQVHSGNNSCSRYSIVFVLKKKRIVIFLKLCTINFALFRKEISFARHFHFHVIHISQNEAIEKIIRSRKFGKIYPTI